MFNVYDSVNNYFSEQLKPLNCKETTKAYIVSIFSKYKYSQFDLSNKSLTLAFYEAKIKNDFGAYQNVGDFIFFCEVIFPEHLKNASKEYYYSLAQISYYKCYLLINKKIDIYENIADEFSKLTKNTKLLIRRI